MSLPLFPDRTPTEPSFLDDGLLRDTDRALAAGYLMNICRRLAPHRTQSPDDLCRLAARWAERDVHREDLDEDQRRAARVVLAAAAVDPEGWMRIVQRIHRVSKQETRRAQAS